MELSHLPKCWHNVMTKSYKKIYLVYCTCVELKQEKPRKFLLKTSINLLNSLTCSLPSSVLTKHVMISYNWANQPMVKRIAKALQECNYNVWLDIEQIGGSTLEASIIKKKIEQREKTYENLLLTFSKWR
jgi:TIR domain